MNLIVIGVCKHIYFFTILYQVLTPFLCCYTQSVVDISGFEACLYPSFSESPIFIPIFTTSLFFHKCIKHTALPGVAYRVVQAFVPTPLSCLKIVRKIASFESDFSRNQVITHHIFRCSLVNTSTLGNVSLISLPRYAVFPYNLRYRMQV